MKLSLVYGTTELLLWGGFWLSRIRRLETHEWKPGWSQSGSAIVR